MPRKSSYRISESDLLLPALKLLAVESTGYLSTTDLKEKLVELFQPEGEDAEILANRNDTRFTQIVRNMISHKKIPGNIIFLGYVTMYIAD
jgi:hypothetical protein